MTAKKTAKTETAKVTPASQALETTDKKVAKTRVPKAEAVEGAAASEPKKRGRKPKAAVDAAPAAAAKKDPKKAAFEEEDIGDIEAEIEGEPEAVEAEVADGATTDDKQPKAKPLRMKVSRAKERALMREFGIDETALSEEEVASAARSSRP